MADHPEPADVRDPEVLERHVYALRAAHPDLVAVVQKLGDGHYRWLDEPRGSAVRFLLRVRA
jgi:hypothetical protein